MSACEDGTEGAVVRGGCRRGLRHSRWCVRVRLSRYWVGKRRHRTGSPHSRGRFRSHESRITPPRASGSFTSEETLLIGTDGVWDPVGDGQGAVARISHRRPRAGNCPQRVDYLRVVDFWSGYLRRRQNVGNGSDHHEGAITPGWGRPAWTGPRRHSGSVVAKAKAAKASTTKTAKRTNSATELM